MNVHSAMNTLMMEYQVHLHPTSIALTKDEGVVGDTLYLRKDGLGDDQYFISMEYPTVYTNTKYHSLFSNCRLILVVLGFNFDFTDNEMLSQFLSFGYVKLRFDENNNVTLARITE